MLLKPVLATRGKLSTIKGLISSNEDKTTQSTQRVSKVSCQSPSSILTI